jgi:hypothetical protein
MRPTRHLGNAALAILVKVIVSRVRIGLQISAKFLEERFWFFVPTASFFRPFPPLRLRLCIASS